MVKCIEITKIECPCGSDTFLLAEHGNVTSLFSTEHPDPKTIKHLALKSKLFCTECGKPSRLFETDLLFVNNDSDDKTFEIPRSKECPVCKGSVFKAEFSTNFYSRPKDLFGIDFYEIIHQIKCANKKCPWKLQSVARSIWSKKVVTKTTLK